LSCLHTRNIIHRDIKPENIIIDKDGYVRITDLGIARFWKPENAQETSGTPGYMAPEVLLRQNHSFCADFYAVGVIAYELLVGRRPYAGRDRKTIREEMLGREAKVPVTFTGQTSSECFDFINRVNINEISSFKGHQKKD
jgi:serine/threonine protein kinase